MSVNQSAAPNQGAPGPHEYAAAGFRILPISSAPKGDDMHKRPLIGGFGAEDPAFTCSPNGFMPGDLCAILTGPCPGLGDDWLIVLDLDGDTTLDQVNDFVGEDLPATLSSKNYHHFFFRVPPSKYRDALGQWVRVFGRGEGAPELDTKWCGGYAIQPPGAWDEGFAPDRIAVLPEAWLKRVFALRCQIPRPAAKGVPQVRPEHGAELGDCGALAAALGAVWPQESGRHEAALALGGILADSWLDEPAIAQFASAVFAAAGTKDRVADVLCSVDTKMNGEPCKGWPSLKACLRGAARGDYNAALKALKNEIPGLKAQTPDLGALVGAQGATANDNGTAAGGLLDQEPDIDRNTDAGNARAFEASYGKELRYCAPLRTWYRWDGVHWKPDAKGDVMKRAKAFVQGMFEIAGRLEDREHSKDAFKWAYKSSSVAGLSALVELAKTEGSVPIAADELDADPYLLNVQNGIVDLRTGALGPHLPAALCTKIAGSTFVRGARSELWEGCLKTWTGGDRSLQDYLQTVVGYAAIGAWREKAFWFLYGAPDGGKSAFLAALAHVFGTYHATADVATWAPQEAGKNRGDLVRLRGARLVTTVEIKPGMKFDEALVNKAVGGDEITFADKYAKEVSWRPGFALILAGNDRMRAREEADGIWARLQCVPFDHPIPKGEQDKKLQEKLRAPAESAAVLAWVVEGARRYLQQSGLADTPECVTSAGADYRKAMNPALEFLAECCEFGADFEITSADLTAALDTWRRGRPGMKAIPGAKLAEALRQKGCADCKVGGTWTDNQGNAHDNRKRGWRGVRKFEL